MSGKQSTRAFVFPAIEVKQGKGRTLYSFACDGKDLPLFATVSRIKRDDEFAIAGYQRPEVSSHIGEIRRYIESESPMLPNGIVVAFNGGLSFRPGTASGHNGVSRSGTLTIKIPSKGPKPGWIVDGQQRTAAIREARVRSFPVFVTGFVAKGEDEQRLQFIPVNSTKPLPKGLIYELLPSTSGALPTTLLPRRFPALLLDQLNNDAASPFHRLIRTPTAPMGVVKDNSILRMLENSLSDGALYLFRDPESGGGNKELMMQVLVDYWTAVRETFPEAWGLPSRKSRLMHGAGIISLGFLMDAIADRRSKGARLPSLQLFRRDLSQLRDVCRWTSGAWEFGPDVRLKWNEIQNTPRHLQILTNHLLVQYKARVWSSASTSGPRTARRPRNRS